jgi:hypothetical protein
MESKKKLIAESIIPNAADIGWAFTVTPVRNHLCCGWIDVCGVAQEENLFDFDFIDDGNLTTAGQRQIARQSRIRGPFELIPFIFR